MNDKQRQNSYVQYFRERYAAPIVLLSLAGFFLLLGVAALLLIPFKLVGVVILVLVLVLGGLGFFVLSLYRRRLPTDQQVTSWMEEEIYRFEQRALEAMKLSPSDLSHPSIVLFGPKLSMAKTLGMFMKKGKDGIIRYTPAGIRVFALTEKRLYVYSGLFNYLKGTFHQEICEKLDYRDIQFIGTRVGTCSSWGTYGIPLKSLIQAGLFQIITPTGKSHVQVLNAVEIETALDGELFMAGLMEERIEQLRSIILEYKEKG